MNLIYEHRRVMQSFQHEAGQWSSTAGTFEICFQSQDGTSKAGTIHVCSESESRVRGLAKKTDYFELHRVLRRLRMGCARSSYWGNSKRSTLDWCPGVGARSGTTVS